MRVLALASYPADAAATRFRIEQLLPALAARDIDVDLVPFLDERGNRVLYDRRQMSAATAAVARGVVRRLGQLRGVGRYDAVLVQREAMLLGPPVFEALLTGLGRRPMVLDLDDATWVGYDSPTYGWPTRLAKWPGKTVQLIDRAAVVTCGSRAIMAFVAGRGGVGRLVPPAVDTELFTPCRRPTGGDPLVGWIGTHSTWPYLRAVLAALRLARQRVPFGLRIVGAGAPTAESDGGPEGLLLEHVAWSRQREPTEFAALDVGLYPLPDDDWARGKSGLKSVQYMACGVPFVASPVGGAADLGEPGVTHVTARTADEWSAAVRDLVLDPERRARMGRAGRAHALAHHTVGHAAEAMADALREATT